MKTTWKAFEFLCVAVMASGLTYAVTPLEVRADSAAIRIPAAPLGTTFVAKQTLAAAATDVTFSSLNGNTDTRYLLECRILCPSGVTPNIELRPNNSTSSLRCIYFNMSGTTTSQAAFSTVARLVQGQASGSVITMTLVLHAKTGSKRVGYVDVGIVGSANAVFRQTNTVCWEDTSTNITSLVIHSTDANGLDTNSEFVLYKFNQS